MAKLSLDALKKYVFSRSGAKLDEVIRGPGVGEDAAVVKVDGLYLVAHTDPITAARKNLGKLAIYVSSNDIAVKGVRPKYALVSLLLREDADESEIDEITEQIDQTSKKLGIGVVGGHTEIVEGLKFNVAVVTQLGVSQREPLDITNIKEGDLLIQVKEAAIEGTSVIAGDFPDLVVQFDEGALELAASYVDEVSVLSEAMDLAEIGVRAMHDPTEGGLIGGATEMALASGLKAVVEEEKILIKPLTRSICSHLNLDPLKLLSSGSVLAAADGETAKRVLDRFGEKASVIGRFEKGEPSLVLIRKDKTEVYKEPPQDEIYKLNP